MSESTREHPDFTAVDHVTITVKDMAAAKHFYADILGLGVKTDVTVEGESTFGGFAIQDGKLVEVVTASGGAVYDGVHGIRHMVVFERVGGVSLSLIAHPGDELTGTPSEKLDRLGYTHLAFDVRDLPSLLTRLKAQGVVESAPGFIQDPDGNLIQLQQVGHADQIHKLYHERYGNDA